MCFTIVEACPTCWTLLDGMVLTKPCDKRVGEVGHASLMAGDDGLRDDCPVSHRVLLSRVDGSPCPNFACGAGLREHDLAGRREPRPLAEVLAEAADLLSPARYHPAHWPFGYGWTPADSQFLLNSALFAQLQRSRRQFVNTYCAGDDSGVGLVRLDLPAIPVAPPQPALPSYPDPPADRAAAEAGDNGMAVDDGYQDAPFPAAAPPPPPPPPPPSAPAPAPAPVPALAPLLPASPLPPPQANTQAEPGPAAPPRRRVRPWTEDEDQRLRDLKAAGTKTYAQMIVSRPRPCPAVPPPPSSPPKPHCRCVP